MSNETLVGLRGRPWKASYSPSDDPLSSFYIPTLERSLAYARIAGFFTSASLSIAAKGIASLVSRGGRIRLLVGAQLNQQDVDAIRRGIELQDALARKFRGILTDPEALADHLVKRRLETLTWLFANDRLDIRVCVEADPQTRVPIMSNGYFHAKSGILRDEYGDAIAFAGSINETATAWQTNYDKFNVFTSWEDGKYFEPEVENFERLWSDAEPGWRTVDLPSAVRDELLILTPPEQPPATDPELDENGITADNTSWIARFVRGAPYLVDDGLHVGVETAAVGPFPHQRAVAYDILDRFSCNHLLADEVGLGKTIEAGLILRSLLISGRIERCLILVPRSLAKQWQEELRDRFLLDVPFYDGRQHVWFGQSHDRYESIPRGESPWEYSPVVIASAQMVKREDRAHELLDAPAWDSSWSMRRITHVAVSSPPGVIAPTGCWDCSAGLSTVLKRCCSSPRLPCRWIPLRSVTCSTWWDFPMSGVTLTASSITSARPASRTRRWTGASCSRCSGPTWSNGVGEIPTNSSPMSSGPSVSQR